MLQNDQIIDVIPIPGDSIFGKVRAILVSHFIWIGGYISIKGSVAFFNEGVDIIPENRFVPQTEDDKIFSEYKFEDVVAKRERMVNVSGEVVPAEIEDPENPGTFLPNPDVYKNEYDFFRQFPLETIIPSISGKVMEDPVLACIRLNLLDLWSKGKIKKAVNQS